MATHVSRSLSSDLKGCRVLLRTYDVDVEGIVNSISADTSRISLVQVVNPDTKAPMMGMAHFYASNIKSCVVLNSAPRKKYLLSADKGGEDGPRLLRVRPIPAHLERLNASHSSHELICHRNEGDDSEVIKKGQVKLMGPPDDLPKFKLPMASRFEIIDESGQTLDEAIAAIKKQHSVAVGFEGNQVGRNGYLSVLAVVAAADVFLFDVQSLKHDLFDKGMREVLESKTIEKVIHGCRRLSDCLFHQFKVNLDNVFDTQVADIIIYRKKGLGDRQHGHLPSFLRGVQHCIKTFLNLNFNQVKYTRSRQNQQDEVIAWNQRPLSLRQIDYLVKDTVYLPELRLLCNEQLLLEFHRGVDFFLGLDRDCTAEELEYAPQDYILPAGFKDILHQSARLGNSNQGKQFRDESSGDYNRAGRDGFRQHHQNYPRFSNGFSRGWERSNTSVEQRGGGVNLGRKRQTDLEEQPANAEDSLLFAADYRSVEKAGRPRELSDSASCEISSTKGMKEKTTHATIIDTEPTSLPVSQNNKEEALDFSEAVAKQTPEFSSGAVQQPSPAHNDRMKRPSPVLSNGATEPVVACGWENRPIAASSVQSFQPADMHV